MASEQTRGDTLIGKVIAGYTLEQLLGTGLSGDVYLARRIASSTSSSGDDVVAIKVLVLPRELAAEDRAEAKKRFLREIRILQQLTHPNILPILGWGEQDGLTYTVLKYAEGKTLADRLRSAKQGLPLQEVEAYLFQMADALDHAHAHKPQQIIHRDVKPPNILLDRQGNVMLGDFSIALISEPTLSTLTSTGRQPGTLPYMSPEQVQGQKVGPATDIYSLGVVVYEMVTGHVPFAVQRGGYRLMQSIIKDPPPGPRQFCPYDLPDAAEAAILKALAKSPKARFSTARAFAESFSAGLHNEYRDVSPVSSPSSPTNRDAPPITTQVDPRSGLGKWLRSKRDIGYTFAIVFLAISVLASAFIIYFALDGRPPSTSGSGGASQAATATTSSPSVTATSTKSRGTATPTGSSGRQTPTSSGGTPSPPTPTATPRGQLAVTVINNCSPGGPGTGNWVPYPSMQVSNSGQGPLNWSGQVDNSSYYLAPQSGTLASGFSVTVNVGGPVPSGNLSVRISSSGGTWQDSLPPCG